MREASLSQTLRISRTPLREALKLLSAEGLVELHAYRGAFVVPLKAGDITGLFEVASALEKFAGELAAVRRSDASLAHLRDLQAQLEALHSAADLVPYFDLNQHIHRAIVAMSVNEVLVKTHESLFGRVERVRFFALSAQGRWAESVQEHREILAALEARDTRRAGDALANHVWQTGIRAKQLLTGTEITGPSASGGPPKYKTRGQEAPNHAHRD